MDAHPVATATAIATLKLAGRDWHLQTTLTAPTGPTRLTDLLPIVQSLTDSVVDAAVESVERKGQQVSCRKGCAACCRQLVPITPVEARRLAELIDALPEPRRLQLQKKFAQARQRLEEAGALDQLLEPSRLEDEERRNLGLLYFHLGIPCPFLEEGESCSIHPDRPVACREYLVTSPAESCAQPSPGNVRCVPLPLRVSHALARCEPGAARTGQIPWVPLIVAPEWAEKHPDEPPPRSGTAWVELLMTHLVGREVNAAEKG